MYMYIYVYTYVCIYMYISLIHIDTYVQFRLPNHPIYKRRTVYNVMYVYDINMCVYCSCVYIHRFVGQCIESTHEGP